MAQREKSEKFSLVLMVVGIVGLIITLAIVFILK